VLIGLVRLAWTCIQCPARPWAARRLGKRSLPLAIKRALGNRPIPDDSRPHSTRKLRCWWAPALLDYQQARKCDVATGRATRRKPGALRPTSPVMKGRRVPKMARLAYVGNISKGGEPSCSRSEIHISTSVQIGVARFIFPFTKVQDKRHVLPILPPIPMWSQKIC
jgi:hypothetical protein